MPLAAIGLILALIVSTAGPAPLSAEQTGRQARFNVWFDYGSAVRPILVEGMVSQPGEGPPDLDAWGLTSVVTPEPIPAEQEGWSAWAVRGYLHKARLIPPGEDGAYHLEIGPLQVQPDVELRLCLPFVYVEGNQVKPPPQRLTSCDAQPPLPSASPSASPLPSPVESPVASRGASPVAAARASSIPTRFASPRMVYTAWNGTSVTIDIPFVPPKREIALTIVPLVGEMLIDKAQSLRVDGTVKVAGLHDFVDMLSYCRRSRLLPRYERVDQAMLSALDFPARSQPLLYHQVYDGPETAKSTYLALKSRVTSCRSQDGGQQVEATFRGHIAADTMRSLPPSWQEFDEADANRPASQRGGALTYDLQLGEILLFPGDTLTVRTPDVQLHTVHPPPARFTVGAGQVPELVFKGPSRFTLRLSYTPTMQLLPSQLAWMPRTLTRPVEDRLLQRVRVPVPLASVGLADLHLPNGLVWGLGLAAAILVLLGSWFQRSARGWRSLLYAGWALAGVAGLYGLDSTYGLLVVAVLGYTWSARTTYARTHDPAAPTPSPNAGRWTRLNGWAHTSLRARIVVALAAIATAIYLDRWAEDAFAELPSLIKSTPATPAIALGLGAILAVLLGVDAWRRRGPVPVSASIAVALALAALALFDVLQESLIAVAMLGLGLAYLARRAAARPTAMASLAVTQRFRRAWGHWQVRIGGIVLVLFAVQNGLSSAVAVVTKDLGVVGLLLTPVLLFASIVEAYLSIGALFLLVYPLLSVSPSTPGYLRALLFGSFLTLIFVFGLGSDMRAVDSLGSAIVGRLVYYTSVPLLIGAVFDLGDATRTRTAAQPTAVGDVSAVASIRSLAPAYFKQLQAVASGISALLALIAPGLNALADNEPLVMTYFDVLEKLLTLPS